MPRVNRSAALFLFLCCSPAFANREGWANARQKAERMERRGEWAEATVWWEAAAETLELGSAPLSALGVAEAKEDGDEGAVAWWAAYGAEDAKLAVEARERARTCAAKAGAIPEETRAPVRQFIDGWIVQDSEQFWKWGRFALRIESRRAAGDPVGALEVEAKGRARWADRYEKICGKYWSSRSDDRRRQDYADRAAEQRKLAQAARDRAAELMKEGWAPEALRAALREEKPEVQRSAVERLAAREDLAGLRLALECTNAGARDLASETRARILGTGPPRDPAALAAGVDVEFREPSIPPSTGQAWEDLEHDWRLQAPAENFPADGWSLRATGFLEMNEDLVAELIVQCDDAIRVRIDGRLVIDEWAAAPEPLFRRAPLKLERGWHSFMLEYEDRSGVAVLRAWLAPGRDQMEPLAPHLRRPASK